jgi:hypothetical protein
VSTADNLPHSRVDVTESGSLKFPETPGPHRPVIGLLYLFYLYIYTVYIQYIYTHTDTHAYTHERSCMRVRIHYGDQISWACEVNSRIENFDKKTMLPKCINEGFCLKDLRLD